MRWLIRGVAVGVIGSVAPGAAAAPFGTDAVVVWAVAGEQDLWDFGQAVSAAGDVNGDGYADLLASAPGARSGSQTGVTELYLGGPDGPADEAAWRVWGGVTGGEVGGEGLAGVGDVDGDGYDDVLVVDGNVNLRLSLYRGNADGLDTTPTWTTRSSGTVSPGVVLGRDFTGDGLVDLVVGTPDRSSSAAWYETPSGFSSQAVLANRRSASQFGRDGAAVGDVNGDGYEDLVLTGTSGPPALFLGRPGGFVEDRAWSPRSTFGAGVAGVGDLDHDGRDDFAHAVATASGWGGVALTLGGSPGPADVPAWTLERVGWHTLGEELVACDVDGDGADELIVQGSSSSVTVYLVYHLTAAVAPAVPAWVVRDPEGAGSRFDEGWAPQAACAGDVDGDGAEELLVGDRTWRNDQGRAYLFAFN